MSSQSAIEWTDSTWNPVRGCTKISPGCKHCYAETIAERFRGVKGHAYEQGFDLRIARERLADPISWSKPRMIFVNSMSDLFHEEIPEAYIREVAHVMAAASWHTYQVLTKRAGRLEALLSNSLKSFAQLDHIWWGVSVEDKKYGLPRLETLRGTNAKFRFLSIEPLLEDLGEVDLRGFSWVIVGGESGPRARKMDVKWVRNIRRQCRRDNVPFFFKQWGGKNKKMAGRLLDGRTYDEYPSIIRKAVPATSIRGQLLEGMSLSRHGASDLVTIKA